MLSWFIHRPSFRFVVLGFDSLSFVWIRRRLCGFAVIRVGSLSFMWVRVGSLSFVWVRRHSLCFAIICVDSPAFVLIRRRWTFLSLAKLVFTIVGLHCRR